MVRYIVNNTKKYNLYTKKLLFFPYIEVYIFKELGKAEAFTIPVPNFSSRTLLPGRNLIELTFGVEAVWINIDLIGTVI